MNELRKIMGLVGCYKVIKVEERKVKYVKAFEFITYVVLIKRRFICMIVNINLQNK